MNIGLSFTIVSLGLSFILIYTALNLSKGKDKDGHDDDSLSGAEVIFTGLRVFLIVFAIGFALIPLEFHYALIEGFVNSLDVADVPYTTQAVREVVDTAWQFHLWIFFGLMILFFIFGFIEAARYIKVRREKRLQGES